MTDRPSVPVDLPGVTADLRTEIQLRLEEFEREHESDVFNDGPGWVPRVKASDYVIAGAVNLVLVVWLILSAIMGIRVSEEAEIAGLDTSELGMEAYPDFSKG